MAFFGEKEMVAGSLFLLQHHKQLQHSNTGSQRHWHSPNYYSLYPCSKSTPGRTSRRNWSSSAGCNLTDNSGILISRAWGMATNFPGVFLCLPVMPVTVAQWLLFSDEHSTDFHQTPWQCCCHSWCSYRELDVVSIIALGRETIRTPADSRAAALSPWVCRWYEIRELSFQQNDKIWNLIVTATFALTISVHEHFSNMLKTWAISSLCHENDLQLRS